MKGMVDISGGKMTLGEVIMEVVRYMLHKTPKRLVVDIQLREDVPNKGYYTKIWISRKDFGK